MIIVNCLGGFSLLQWVKQYFDHCSHIIAIIQNEYEHRRRVYDIGIYDYISTPIIYDEVIVRTKACLLLHQLTNNSDTPTSTLPLPTTPINTSKEAILTEKVCRYLSKDLSQNHTMDSIALAVASNRNNLAIAFKTVHGRGVFSWLRELRMKQAEQLLRNSQLTIQQISYEVGYPDPANFSTTFKRFYRLSPAKYRRKMMGSK